MKSTCKGVCAWVLAGLVVGTMIPGTSKAATELAKINNSVITLEDFNKKYQENLRFFQAKPPTKKSVLDDLIKRELGIQEAKRLKLNEKPEVVDRINTVLYHALLEKNLTKDFEEIHVTDDEAKSYYKRNPIIRTSHIFVALRPNASEPEQKQAHARIKKINDDYIAPGKMSFAEVAQRFSEGPAAPMGGDLDYQSRDRLDPSYYETALKLSVGGTSGIVKSQFGYHIIKKTAERSWEEVDKAEVKRMVFDEQREKIFEKYMTALRSQAKVSVRSELLRD